jgi:hypothetical protein
MQVFLPDSDLKKSVQCLDPSRLGNQIYREGLTLLRGGWSKHPVAKMWADYKPALALYCLYGLLELEARGRNYLYHAPEFVHIIVENQYYTHSSANICISKALTGDIKEFVGAIAPTIDLPCFVGDSRLHSSHRAALLYKGICDTTFTAYRGNELPNLKKDWTPDTYEYAWMKYGQPLGWYDQFGWGENPEIKYWWPNLTS